MPLPELRKGPTIREDGTAVRPHLPIIVTGTLPQLCPGILNVVSAQSLRVVALTVVGLLCAACEGQTEAPPPQIRPVRTVTIALPGASPNVEFTGHIEAQDQAALSFRIGGRMAERLVGVGAMVRDGQPVARLDAENELNELRAARAQLSAVEGFQRQADGQYQRQSHLLARGVTTRADFEAAEQARRAAQAQVEAAEAHVRTAEDVVGFTTLKADAPGIVTAIGAEPGEVVAMGRMIVQLARRDGRDAVFEIPADLVRSVSPDTRVVVRLASDPNIKASGRVREVGPQADPVTRTFRIRVGLADPPPALRLGTAVSGTISGAELAALTIPTTTLTQRGQDTGVWLIDPKAHTASWRKVEVSSADAGGAVIANGLGAGDIVVTAGASLLRDGQAVRLDETKSQ